MSVGAFKVGFYFYFFLRFLKARFRRLIEPSPEGASAKGRLVQKMAGELISALGSGHRGTGCGT